MKYKCHVPTEEYGFAEVEWESNDFPVPPDPKDVYDEVKKQFTTNFGLDTKEWNKALDEYLTTNSFTNPDETFFKMSPTQQAVIQEIKKSIKRLEK